MVERFIRCRQCNQLLPVFCVFGDFEGDLLPGVEWSREDVDFRRDFASAHANHSREELWINSETIFSERPSLEPVRTSYFEATNGREIFLIRRTKSGLAHPAQYEILPGQMEILNLNVEIQETELRRQISAEQRQPILSAEKISFFIEAFREEAAAVSPRRLSEAAEETAEGESPAILYASWKERRLAKILERCARRLQPAELNWVREFISRHRRPGDVLSLLVHRRLSLSDGERPSHSGPEA